MRERGGDEKRMDKGSRWERKEGRTPRYLRSLLNGYYLDSVSGLGDGWRQFYTKAKHNDDDEVAEFY